MTKVVRRICYGQAAGCLLWSERTSSRVFQGGECRSIQLSVDKETEARTPAKTSLRNPS